MKIIKIKIKINPSLYHIKSGLLDTSKYPKEPIIVDWSVIGPYNELLPVIGYLTLTSRFLTHTSRISGEIRPMTCKHQIIIANKHYSTFLFSLFLLILVYSDRYDAARRILTAVLLYFIKKTDT